MCALAGIPTVASSSAVGQSAAAGPPAGVTRSAAVDPAAADPLIPAGTLSGLPRSAMNLEGRW
jgi:hypothetical protein